MKNDTNNERRCRSFEEVVHSDLENTLLRELTEAFRDYCDSVHALCTPSAQVAWDKVFQILMSPLCSIKPGFGKEEKEQKFLRACQSKEVGNWKKSPKDALEKLSGKLEGWEKGIKTPINKVYLITSSYWSPLHLPGEKRHTVTNIDIEESPCFFVDDWQRFSQDGEPKKAKRELVDWWRENEPDLLPARVGDGASSVPGEDEALKRDFVDSIEKVKRFWEGRLWPLFLEITKQCREQLKCFTLNAFVAEKARWKSTAEIRVGVKGREKSYTVKVLEELNKLIEDAKAKGQELTSKRLADALLPVLNASHVPLEILEIPFSVVQKITESELFQAIGTWLDAEGQAQQEPDKVAKNFIDLVNALCDDTELELFLAYVRAYIRINFELRKEEASDPLTNQAALVMVGGILIYLYPFLRKLDSGQLSDMCLSLHLFPMELEETCVWNVVTQRPIRPEGWHYFRSMSEKLFTNPLVNDLRERDKEAERLKRYEEHLEDFCHTIRSDMGFAQRLVTGLALESKDKERILESLYVCSDLIEFTDWLCRPEQHEIPSRIQPVNLWIEIKEADEVVRAVPELLRLKRAADIEAIRKMTPELNCGNENLTVETYPSAVKLVLRDLLRNAYANCNPHEQSAVTISLVQGENGQPTVIIENNGEERNTAQQDEWRKIVEWFNSDDENAPFPSGGVRRSRRIGLSIVRRIAIRLGWKKSFDPKKLVAGARCLIVFSSVPEGRS